MSIDRHRSRSALSDVPLAAAPNCELSGAPGRVNGLWTVWRALVAYSSPNYRKPVDSVQK
jgi:hypothetical protein